MNRWFVAARPGLTLAVSILLALTVACSLSRSGSGNPPATPGQQSGGGSAGPTNTDSADVIYIPPATFVMGAAANDTAADDDERPAHQVSLEGFYIYAREVTNRMYAECVHAGACFPVQPLPNGPTSHHNNPAYADHPVVGVDWNMARDYCRWAGGRLPTEAEWELAARGAEDFLYPWGNDPAPACDRLNMFGCLTPPDTRQVGSYPLGVSPFGLFDMAGNVWEWVNDWYDEAYYALSAAANPLGPSAPPDPQQPLKVVRGGGWNSYPQDLRLTARASANPHLPYDDVGFRCTAQSEAWPSDLTLPEPGHALPESGGPEEVGVRVGENSLTRVRILGMTSTCPDSQGNVHINIQFEVSANFDERYRYSGSLYSSGADTFPCQYDPAQHLLHCAGPADRLETRRSALGDDLYVVQVCLMDDVANQVVGCGELLVLANTHCSGDNWMTGCEVVCNGDNSLNLVCKSNHPDIIQWMAQQWRSVWNVAQPLNNCSTIFEPAGQPAQAVTLVCEHNFLQPDSNDNLTFDFCSQSSCPYSITLPYPANCLPPATPWQLVNYGCQNENIIFVVIDTGLSDLQNLLQHYDTHDCEHQCACVFLDGQPSRLYCYCPEPSSECPVNVCLTIGGVERCQEFQYAGVLPCEAQPEEPQQPVDPCNQYNTPETCKDHSLPPESCWWDNAVGVCRSP